MTNRRRIVTDTGDTERVFDGKGGSQFATLLPEDEALPVGRPTTIQWEAAMRHVIAKVHFEQGLPLGHGGKAKVIAWINDWMKQRGVEASQRLVKERVNLIYDELNDPTYRDE
jgi:hypothetical protein